MKFTPQGRSSPNTPALAVLAGAIPVAGAGVTAFLAYRARQAVVPATAAAAPSGTTSPRAGFDFAKGQVDTAVRSLIETTGSPTPKRG